MLKTEKAALLAALNVVNDAVKAKNTIPILADVLIEKDGAGITLTGGNLSMEIRSHCAAEVDGDFPSFTCPAARLLAIVKAAPDTRITIEVVEGGQQVQIRSGKSRLKLPAMKGPDYPKLDVGKVEHTASLNASSMQKAIDGVAFAAETAADRPYLCGVYLHADAKGMHLVATNGRVLAKRTLPAIEFDQDVSTIPGIIVPNEAIGPITKILGSGEDAEIQISKEKLVVAVGKVRMITKLIDGTFPDYVRIMPAKESITAGFSAQALASAVNRVIIATPDAGFGMSFDFTADRLALAARDAKAGEGEDEIAVTSSGDLVTGFNGRFVDQALSHLDGDDAELKIGKDAAPALLRRKGDEDNYIILMPTKVRAG